MDAVITYYDGKQSTPHRVYLEQHDLGLVIRQLPDGAVLDKWKWQDIRISAKPSNNIAGILYHAVSDDARLIIPQDVWQSIIGDKLKTHDHTLGLPSGILLILGGLLASLFLIFYVPGVLDDVAQTLPVSWEEKVGAWAESSLTEQFTPCGKSAEKPARSVEKMMNSIGNKNKKYKVIFVDNKAVNALTIAGDRVFVFKGLLDAVRNQNEFIGVIAHEMAHMYKRHAFRAVISQGGLRLLLLLTTGNNSMVGAANTMMEMKHSREMEAEADLYAVSILKHHNINPAGLTNFLRSILITKDWALFEWISDHPDTQYRIDQLEAVIHSPQSNNKKPREEVMTQEEWQGVLKACADTTPHKAKTPLN